MTGANMHFGTFALVQPSVSLEHGTAYPFIAMEDVKPGRRSVDPGSERIWAGGGGARFENGDVLFARITPCLEHGKTAQVANLEAGAGFGSTEFFVFRGREHVSDNQYIYYLARSDILREPAIKSMVGASGRQRAQRRVIEEILVPSPSIAIQQQIAAILSAYDDLIENNRRRMALLEEAARQLYREWFVRLRFPGYEHTRINKGVPEGWNSFKLDDLCQIGRGASPRPISNFMGGDIPWFKIGDATASESFFILQTKEHVTEDGAKKSVLLEPDSIILSNSATCGIPYFTGVRGCVHDGWLHFADFKRISEQFLYFFLYFKQEELVSSVGDGSTQKNLNTAAVRRLRVTLPQSNSLLDQFDDCVRPMHSMIFNLAMQNISLCATRDLLLSRFMTGAIRV